MSLKRFLLFAGLSLSVFTINAQLCDITPSKFKGCRGDHFEFSIDAQPFSYYSIKWEFGDGFISNQKTSFFQHLYDTFGVFTIKVTLFSDASGTIKCGPKSITITINDLPNAIIGLLSPTKQNLKGNMFEFVDNSLPGMSHAPIIQRYWNFGDGGIDSVPNPVYSYHQSGTYLAYILIADTNGCFDTASKYVTIPYSSTSIIESAKSTEFFLYPNPFTKSVNVNIPRNKTITEINLLDLSGNQILFRKIIRENNIEIFRDGLPRGMYILKIIADKVSVYKIMAE